MSGRTGKTLVPQHLLAVLCVLAAALAAPLRPLLGQESADRWHLGAGSASMHRSDRTGYFASLGYTREVDSKGRLRAGVRIATGSADEGFLAAAARAEVVPVPGQFGSPYLAGEVGGLWEPEFRGGVFTIEVGVLIRATDRLGLRGFAGWGSHDGLMGPRYVGLGIDVRG